MFLSARTYGTWVKPEPRALHCFLDSELCRIQGPVHCLKKLLAKPDICRCKRSLFTKIPPRNASLSAADNQVGELRSHASGQDFARMLPGPAPPWGPGGAQIHQGGTDRAELHPRQGAGQLGTAGFNQESRSSDTSVVVRWVQGQAGKSVRRPGSRGSMAGDRHPNITAQVEV